MCYIQETGGKGDSHVKRKDKYFSFFSTLSDVRCQTQQALLWQTEHYLRTRGVCVTDENQSPTGMASLVTSNAPQPHWGKQSAGKVVPAGHELEAEVLPTAL